MQRSSADASISRRRVLAGLGVLLAAPVAYCLGPDQRANEPSTGRRTPSPEATTGTGPAGRPVQYSYGLPTQTLLERTGPHIVALTGTFTTPYHEESPIDDKTWDMRRARFSAYFDKDAVFETNSFAGGSTSQQKNNRPIELGRAMAMGNAAIIGGVIEGGQPQELTWERMKYGEDIQRDTDAWVEAGSPEGVEPHRNQNDNDNQDGDPRMYVKEGTWAVWDGVRVRNSHDGIGLYRYGRDGAAMCYIRNCWLMDIRDDAIENDEWHDVHIYDCLIENAYTFLSTIWDKAKQPSKQVQTVEDSIIRLRPFPGGYETHSTDSVHGTIYKMRPDSPALVLRNTIVASELFREPDGSGPILPTRSGSVTDVYENVTLVWLGTGDYPGNVPTGCTLTTDVSVYDNAVASWKARHGVTDFHDVDMTKMLNPAPPGGPGQ